MNCRKIKIHSRSFCGILDSSDAQGLIERLQKYFDESFPDGAFVVIFPYSLIIRRFLSFCRSSTQDRYIYSFDFSFIHLLPELIIQPKDVTIYDFENKEMMKIIDEEVLIDFLFVITRELLSLR